MAPLITFLAHRDRLTRDAIQKRLHDRLVKQAGCRNVRYVPSRIRRRYVYADVDPAMFLDAAYPVDDMERAEAHEFTRGSERQHGPSNRKQYGTWGRTLRHLNRETWGWIGVPINKTQACPDWGLHGCR